MKKVVRLTESDLARIVKRVMNEAPLKGPSGVARSTTGALVRPNLVIDCNRKVIQNTDVHLLQQGNSMVINAFCTPSYRKPTGGK
jgi:hypothetical protein